jgi:hypothetical protein
MNLDSSRVSASAVAVARTAMPICRMLERERTTIMLDSSEGKGAAVQQIDRAMSQAWV